MEQKELNVKKIQWVVWIVVFLLMVTYSIRSKEAVLTGLSTSSINFGISLLAIYSQSSFLIPRWLEKEKQTKYFVFAIITFLFIVVLRTMLDYFILNKLVGLDHFFNLKYNHIAFAALSVFLCFVIGFLLRISLNYVSLLKRQEEMKAQHSSMELSLLKAQVQPHFMFNTLNNIYSLAYKKSDKTAEVVSRLSDIMRYLVYEAGKELVPISSEITFIESYIELEKIRMVNPVKIDMDVNVAKTSALIPPMLFIPFIENYFKHGVDKTRTDNQLNVKFNQNGAELILDVKNSVRTDTRGSSPGLGLQNVKKRLDILFKDNYLLAIKTNEEIFHVTLKIPCIVK